MGTWLHEFVPGELLVTTARTDIIKDQPTSVSGYSLTDDLGISRIYFMNYDVLDRTAAELSSMISCPLTIEMGEALVYLGDNYVFVPRYNVLCRMNDHPEAHPKVGRA